MTGRLTIHLLSSWVIAGFCCAHINSVNGVFSSVSAPITCTVSVVRNQRWHCEHSAAAEFGFSSWSVCKATVSHISEVTRVIFLVRQLLLHKDLPHPSPRLEMVLWSSLAIKLCGQTFGVFPRFSRFSLPFIVFKYHCKIKIWRSKASLWGSVVEMSPSRLWKVESGGISACPATKNVLKAAKEGFPTKLDI